MSRETPLRTAIFVLPGFPLMAFSALVEPLRAANLLSGQARYRWVLVSADGGLVPTSSGVQIQADHAVHEDFPVDRVFVCSGGTAHLYDCPTAWTWLRRCARRGASLGAVADGTYFLARAGLMDGFACTIHWLSRAAFAEQFPDIELRPELYVIDRSRLTSAGGIAAFDLTLELIEQDCGSELALEVSEWFVHERLRGDADREALTLRLRTGLNDALVLRAIALMERALETPLSLAAIADDLGVSRDGLERRFRRVTGLSPHQYYLKLRFERARTYLSHSWMKVGDIALACGFSDPAYFSSQFKQRYGITPSRHRAQTQKGS